MISKDFKRAIRLSPLAKSKIYHLMRFHMKKHGINDVLKKSGYEVEDENETVKLMKEAMVNYHWDFDEFIMYHYTLLSPLEREMIVPEYEKNIFCDEVNDFEKAKIFDSKWDSYCHFKSFYGP